jgi:quercetin dioxygenase-like cupin family protein
MSDNVVIPAEKALVETFDWGKLTWNANTALGNSEHMTFGQCRLYAGCENPRHYHPNCEEILHLLSGRILHSLGNETFEMNAGDTIVIPSNMPHNARNLSATHEATMFITFSSPTRETIGESG